MPTFRGKFFSLFIFTCGILVKYRQEKTIRNENVCWLSNLVFLFICHNNFFHFLKKKNKKKKSILLRKPYECNMPQNVDKNKTECINFEEGKCGQNMMH